MTTSYDKTRDHWEQGSAVGISDPARSGALLTPNDSADLTKYTRALWVDVAGNIKVILIDDDDANAQTFTVAAGLVPFQIRKLYSTGTTATGIHAIY